MWETLTFLNNNNDDYYDIDVDIDIDGEILIQFNYFTNLDALICNIGYNNGNYMFDMMLNGNISFNHCNI